MRRNPGPTVFHITHSKAGSQWIREVLLHCASERFVPQEVQMAQLYQRPIQPGAVYGAVYLPKEQFRALLSLATVFRKSKMAHPLANPRVPLQNWYNFQVRRFPHIKFVVIRDLRDTLVSLYFSLKVSHPLITDLHKHWREKLRQVGKEDGLIFLMQKRLKRSANIQISWLNSDALLVRYEDFLKDEYRTFEKIIDHCQLGVSRQRLHEIVKYNSFEAATGRKRGEEDVGSHLRKGIPGDWKNHFTPLVNREFKKHFGDVLIRTGYEKGLDW